MTAPAFTAATAAAIALCGLCALPSPRPAAAASTNEVQRGIAVVRAVVTARGTLPCGSGVSGEADVVGAGVPLWAGMRVIAGLGEPLDGNGWPAPVCTSAISAPKTNPAAIAAYL